MKTFADTDREFWRGVLTAGGFTAIPRWSVDPVKGVAEHEEVLLADLVTALSGVAGELGVPLGSVLLAAHAKVLGVLAGESEVVTELVVDGDGRALPCRVSVGAGSWRSLVMSADEVAAAAKAHGDFPVEVLRGELGVAVPLCETVFDAIGAGGDLGEGTVLWVGFCWVGARLALRLRYRREVVDASCAGRIAGYHVAALGLMVADVDDAHDRQSVLSADEWSFQLTGLAGPDRVLPDCRVHELFERRVAEHPDAVAAVCGERSWSYRELNGRANRLARALVARGVVAEEPVAVVCERNLDWLAAVLAVFKAGGVYVPIEPGFPAERIARVLRRARCGLVLTEAGGSVNVDVALGSVPGVARVLIDQAYQEGHAEDDLGIAVRADQLAYIYFTSGSTGEPKGAMCEHAGMLNHVFAKIDDLGIGAGQVVAQVAPQCFDISLWQLVSALMVGGRTLVVRQEVILDVARFVDTIVAGEVTVLQVVPSYLEVVLSYLQAHPRQLPSLRYVSVTGEAVKKELVARWFATVPEVKLVNAYGLTETSDDTNHEVMERVPEGDRVPLGRCVNNVRVYVVDEHLAPVPLGAPGLIVFSGVCVGRGYVNDPERTAAAYLDDPYRPGTRLYKGGDYGRWLPDGKLEFLGRRDSQVKISGFRIEIGEIDNALTTIPGVRDGAVVVGGRAGQPKHLVAFYSGPEPLPVEVLRERLGAVLPAYMVPMVFHWRERLPLTLNSKINTKALTALAAELETVDTVEDGYHPPATPTEHHLASTWASVLGLTADRIGRHDHFFELGGTSLSAVKLAIALKRTVTLKDITGHATLADLATLIDRKAERVAEPQTV